MLLAKIKIHGLFLFVVTISWGCTNMPLVAQDDEYEEVRMQVVSTALTQLGRPYHWGGDHPKEGFDCSGLVHYSYLQAGVSVPRTSREQYRQSRAIRLSQLRPGDLIFFRLKSRRISHVAIYVGDNRFVHAPKTGKDVSFADLDNPYWRKYMAGAGRLL
jgi:cell wall-associated NlpC family hydrolase